MEVIFTNLGGVITSEERREKRYRALAISSVISLKISEENKAKY